MDSEMEENESVVAMQERANALLREARESVSFSDVLTSHARGPSADRRGGSEPRASKAERLKEEQKNVVRAIAYAIGQFDRKALSDAVIDATAVGVKHKCVLQAALLKQVTFSFLCSALLFFSWLVFLRPSVITSRFLLTRSDCIYS